MSKGIFDIEGVPPTLGRYCHPRVRLVMAITVAVKPVCQKCTLAFLFGFGYSGGTL